MKPVTMGEVYERVTADPVGAWRTKDGRLLTPAEMDPTHRANLLRFLETRAAALRVLDLGALLPLYRIEPGGEGAQLAQQEEWSARLEETPQTWLRRQPLYRALRKLVRAEDRQ